MAQFSNPTYSSTGYATHRPNYPSFLFTSFLLPYHTGSHSLLLDLGCGPGFIARSLSPNFISLIGADPSSVMLDAARSSTPQDQYPNITYQIASAEHIPFLSDSSVDVVTVGQAAHWFDHPAWWKEMARVVKPGGTVMAVGYRDWIFPHFPAASVVARKYSHEEGFLGGFWQQPGRSYVDDRLRVLRPPREQWEDVRRWEYEPEFEVESTEEQRKYVLEVVEEENDGGEEFGSIVWKGKEMMRQKWKLGAVENYWATWSSYHSWKEAHPQHKARSEGGGGDILDWAWDEMVKAEGWDPENWREMEVDIVFPSFAVIARRK